MSNNLFDLKIFEWIEKDVVKNIINNCEKRAYKSGDLIISQNDESNNEWYIINSWEVSVLINWTSVANLWVWEIFWEIALLNEEQRTASVVANSPLEVFVITQDTVIDMVNNWNESINRDIMDRIEQNLKNNF